VPTVSKKAKNKHRAFWVGKDTGDKYKGHTVYVHKSGKYYYYTLNKHGYPKLNQLEIEK
jgi:uncharacterized protein (DUF2147 family)